MLKRRKQDNILQSKYIFIIYFCMAIYAKNELKSNYSLNYV